MKEINVNKIEKKITTKTTIDSYEVRLTKKELEEIIFDYLKNTGIKPIRVHFNSTYKYITDDWGMNQTLISNLVDAVVEVEKPE